MSDVKKPGAFMTSAMVLITGMIMLAACHNKTVGNQETPTSGTIHISVDESFQPVMDSEVKVFENSFPDAKILVDYKPEAACFKDLQNDSTRMIIVTRGLQKSEESFYKDSFQFIPVYGLLAYDAVAVVMNNKEKDSIFTMDEIRSILSGTDQENRQVVMDGVSATSTVRFAMDSVLRGKPLGKNVVAARSSKQVLDYVASHEHAIGFIGVSWIGDQEDSTALAFLTKVKVAAIQCERCPDKPYVKPFQANIALGRYPMVRGLYYIIKENYNGVGNNFVNFLQYERGQLVFRRAFLVPSRMTFEVRDVEMKN